MPSTYKYRRIRNITKAEINGQRVFSRLSTHNLGVRPFERAERLAVIGHMSLETFRSRLKVILFGH